jgi:hypothetical protein
LYPSIGKIDSMPTHRPQHREGTLTGVPASRRYTLAIDDGAIDERLCSSLRV